MAYRTQTQAFPRELHFLAVLAQRAPAAQLQSAETRSALAESSSGPEEAEHFLRWLRLGFGCETG